MTMSVLYVGMTSKTMKKLLHSHVTLSITFTLLASKIGLREVTTLALSVANQLENYLDITSSCNLSLNYFLRP